MRWMQTYEDTSWELINVIKWINAMQFLCHFHSSSKVAAASNAYNYNTAEET